jgi:dihydroorotate dehydrogenase electron transfer subunit
MKQEMMLVVEQKEIAKNIFELTLKGELVKQMETSGQFIHIRVPRSDLLLRRPISLASVSMDDSTCKVIYRADGDGTKAISELSTGDKLDVM